jgi:hypothetical protein
MTETRADPVGQLRAIVAELEDTDDHFLGDPAYAACYAAEHALHWVTRRVDLSDATAAQRAVRVVRDAGLDRDADAYAALWSMRASGLVGDVPGLDDALVTWRRGAEAGLAADAVASGEGPVSFSLPEWSTWGPEPWSETGERPDTLTAAEAVRIFAGLVRGFPTLFADIEQTEMKAMQEGHGPREAYLATWRIREILGLAEADHG